MSEIVPSTAYHKLISSFIEFIASKGNLDCLAWLWPKPSNLAWAVGGFLARAPRQREGQNLLCIGRRWLWLDLSCRGAVCGKKSGTSHLSLTWRSDMGEVCCSTQGACRQSYNVWLFQVVLLLICSPQDGCVGYSCSAADSCPTCKRRQGGGGVRGEDWELLPQVRPRQEGHAHPGWVLQCHEAAERGWLHKRRGEFRPIASKSKYF